MPSAPENVNTLVGSRTVDLMRGSLGADTFAFVGGYGEDTIKDFAAGSGGDLIYISGLILDYADLMANHISQSGNNTIIDDDAGNTITLLNVNLTDLTADNFMIAEYDE